MKAYRLKELDPSLEINVFGKMERLHVGSVLVVGDEAALMLSTLPIYEELHFGLSFTNNREEICAMVQEGINSGAISIPASRTEPV